MTLKSTGDSSSIFKDGKLEPGIYKIQNLYAETYLDIELHSGDMCCRPTKDLEEGRGIWEIKQFGPGYTVQRFNPGEPEQFCAPLNGIQDRNTLRVGAYPVAWRVEAVDDDKHRGFGYIRFFWGTEKIVWDLHGGQKNNGTKVVAYQETLTPWQTWRLVPAKVGDVFTHLRPPSETMESESLPSYEGNSRQSSTRSQHAESERDEFRTIVTEVTVVTTTTRKRYRVDHA